MTYNVQRKEKEAKLKLSLSEFAHWMNVVCWERPDKPSNGHQRQPICERNAVLHLRGNWFNVHVVWIIWTESLVKTMWVGDWNDSEFHSYVIIVWECVCCQVMLDTLRPRQCLSLALFSYIESNSRALYFLSIRIYHSGCTIHPLYPQKRNKYWDKQTQDSYYYLPNTSLFLRGLSFAFLVSSF